MNGERFRINGEKYKLVFSEPAHEVGPIPKGSAAPLQGPFYTTLSKLERSETLADLRGQ